MIKQLNAGVAKAALYGIFVLVSLCVLTQKSRAESDVIAGLWTGGGTVTFASGDRERARCRVHYTPRSSTHISAAATCATPSGSVSQTALLTKTGEGRYSGRFFNEQYSVSGIIHVTLKGTSQFVRLISGSGSALLTLTR